MSISRVTFPRDLVLRRKREALDGHLFFTEHAYSVEYDHDGRRWRYTVPKDYATDLASVPRGFRNIASKLDGVEASIIHDHAYEYGTVPRDVADALFLALMEAGGVSWMKRQVMYAAVRAGGWAIYSKAAGETDGPAEIGGVLA
jgi:hypothetical protein